jgi:hypothetical protein
MDIDDLKCCGNCAKTRTRVDFLYCPVNDIAVCRDDSCYQWEWDERTSELREII